MDDRMRWHGSNEAGIALALIFCGQCSSAAPVAVAGPCHNENWQALPDKLPKPSLLRSCRPHRRDRPSFACCFAVR